ncbi:Rec8 like protein-domain-containing protein [Cunninghamella echinulata]|nr:Rec8 like protein-domain-containing protein [Cunninghamella echinulata]
MLSDQLTAKQGPLSRVWLASHWERKISKAQFLHTNLNTAIDCIYNNQTQEPIALRISGQLLLGIVRIHSRKTRYLLEDCNGALTKIKTAFKKVNVNMSDTSHIKANLDTITLPQRLDEFDLLLPETEFTTARGESDPVLDSLMTQNGFLDTQELPFDETIELGRLLEEGGEQSFYRGLGHIEMARREVEPALLEQPYVPEALGTDLDKLHIHDQPDTDVGAAATAGHDDGFDFDFDLGDGGDEQRRGMTPLPEFTLPGQENVDSSLDALMETGIVPVSEPDHIVFGMTEESLIEQQQPEKRRRRRLVVDKVTEIPFDELRQYVNDTSSIVDRTIDIQVDITPKTTKIDLNKPTGCIEGSEIQKVITKWNQKQNISTLINEPRWDTSIGATLPAHAGRYEAISEEAGEQFDFGEFDFQDGAAMIEDTDLYPDVSLPTRGVIPQGGEGFSEEISFGNIDTQQPILIGTSTRETMNKVQQKCQQKPQGSILFNELTTFESKRSDVARSFFDVLLLASKDMIKVNQQIPYSSILIESKV